MLYEILALYAKDSRSNTVDKARNTRERFLQSKKDIEMIHNISFQRHLRHRSSQKTDKTKLPEKKTIQPVKILPPTSGN